MALFPCPNCGRTDAWRADYYEAVWQTITLERGEGGEPVFGEYDGVTGSYDDGSTEDECWKCGACGHELPLGRFALVSVAADAQALDLSARLLGLAQALRDGGPLMDAVTTVLAASAVLEVLAGKPPLAAVENPQ